MRGNCLQNNLFWVIRQPLSTVKPAIVQEILPWYNAALSNTPELEIIDCRHCFSFLMFYLQFFLCLQNYCRICTNQGLTLAMCPLARTHFLGGRASSGHNK